jgi:hypothetical protein
MTTTIPTGPAWVIPACLNEMCQNHTKQLVLPRQSHLGKFDDLPNPTKEIWPILFLCQTCGHMSEILDALIHPATVEKLGQNQLVRYDFASDQSGSLQHCAIYTQETEFDIAYRALRSQNGSEAIEKILKVSEIWDGSYEGVCVSVDKGLEHKIPKTFL